MIQKGTEFKKSVKYTRNKIIKGLFFGMAITGFMLNFMDLGDKYFIVANIFVVGYFLLEAIDDLGTSFAIDKDKQ